MTALPTCRLLIVTFFFGVNSWSQSVQVFERPDFRGRSKTLGVGTHRFYTNTRQDFNDIISSIKVPRGYVVLVYEHMNAAGGFGLSADLVRDCSNLSKLRMDDKISFIRVMSTRESPHGDWATGAWVDGHYVPGHWQQGCKKAGGGMEPPIYDPQTSPHQVRVMSPKELIDTLLSTTFQGEVIIPAGFCFNLTGQTDLPIRSGVSLIGERGYLGQRPCIMDDYLLESHNLFMVYPGNVTVSGIHFIGPSKRSRAKLIEPSQAINVDISGNVNFEGQILITENEFSEWPEAGVKVQGHDVNENSEYKNEWDRPDLRRYRNILIRGNYFHHNARDAKGYGVMVGGGVYVAIEGNIFDFNRHAIAGMGKAFNGYFAKYNYCMEGGFIEEGDKGWSYYNQHFDFHGSGPGGYHGHAGYYTEIKRNTFRGEQNYTGGSRPAFMLRAPPDSMAVFAENVTAQYQDRAVKLDDNDFDLTEDEEEFRYKAYGNIYNTDYSRNIKAGDFDGDKRTDVFIATGTGWFYSRAGIKPWEFLSPSMYAGDQIGFADMNGDCIMDVIYRTDEGALGYYSGGKGNIIYLNIRSSALMKHLRFGDFNGDGKTDIFYSWNGEWFIWFQGAADFIVTQNSDRPVEDFVFGYFDNAPGMDVAAIVNGKLSVSSGGLGSWTPLNYRIKSTVRGTVAEDFDGNGKTDIAWTDGSKWKWSRDGKDSVKVMVDFGNDGYVLERMITGQFIFGFGPPQVVGYEINLTGPVYSRDKMVGNRFNIWLGLDSNRESKGPIIAYSEQNMR